MVDIETARQVALSLKGTVEQDHFGMPSFRVNKRIFSTLWVKEHRMMVKLSPIDQSVFNSFDPAIFYPVPNKWGLKGATFIELDKVRSDMLNDALTLAWEKVK
ncbi:MmcQ/YjbR family DNA-binding protein [Mucilaginibacter sp. OK098]|uniref:MmcQ/YjbR family DNA-binding protein n=1 Tax=Mucilaginibacter sp. OK098 TaxID=1855297 RepID=UPI00091646AF|nr:MmcQ/YjbR family DNA-binding protein [Mucilaginibacter sp. OK098]SHN10963.1 YjbR protein [Mucilaginibacter sp. OK098]